MIAIMWKILLFSIYGSYSRRNITLSKKQKGKKKKSKNTYKKLSVWINRSLIKIYKYLILHTFLYWYEKNYIWVNNFFKNPFT